MPRVSSTRWSNNNVLRFDDVNDLTFDVAQFSDEKLYAVTIESDVMEFSDYHSYEPICENHVNEFRRYVRDCRLLRTAKSLFPSEVAAPNRVVGTLKYSFAFRCLLNSSGDSSSLLDTPYFLEAEADLVVSMFLACHRHYKHAVQLLRSALEAAVTHAYQSVAGIRYDDLLHFRAPPFARKCVGMIDRLVAARRLRKNDAIGIFMLYRELSLATHSHYNYLGTKFERIFDTDIFLRFLRLLRGVSCACICLLEALRGIEKYSALPSGFDQNIECYPIFLFEQLEFDFCRFQSSPTAGIR